jgi:nucleotide-binding universal stress UspA family protein
VSRANRKTKMDSFKRILAVTDLSIPARHAAQRAALVGRDTSTPLELLHIAQLAPLVRMRRLMSTVTSNFEQEVIEAAERKLRELAAALETQYGVTPGFRVTQGSLLSELAKESGSLKDGLLVCGARGESVVRHFVMGSTALRLLNAVACSILVVKQLPHEPYRKVLIPVDFSPSSRRSVEQAKHLAPHSEFTLLHAFEAPSKGTFVTPAWTKALSNTTWWQPETTLSKSFES